MNPNDLSHSVITLGFGLLTVVVVMGAALW